MADAVIDMDDEIAGLEVGKIAEKAGGLGPRALQLRRRFKQIGIAIEGDAGFGENDAFGERRLHQNHRRSVAGCWIPARDA